MVLIGCCIGLEEALLAKTAAGKAAKEHTGELSTLEPEYIRYAKS